MLDTVIRLEGAPNFRDVGGAVGADGRRVRRGHVFRSGSLCRLTPLDFDQMVRLGVRVVYDLRSQAERAHRPIPWPDHCRLDVAHLDVNADIRTGNDAMLDILRRDPTARGATAMMLSTYRAIPKALRTHLAVFYRQLAKPDGTPVVFHCSAGKDRTGVLSAILLRSLGVSEVDTIEDYLLTGQSSDAAALEATVRDVMTHMLGTAPDADVVTAVAAVRPNYLDAALRSIEEEHGSLTGYLLAAGVDGTLLHEVRDRLLERE